MTTRPQRYWLMKCEPTSYSIDDLAREQVTFWNGVRNFQARNFLRDDIALGDRVLFYHSNAEPSGVAGLARVVKNGYADHSALDPQSKYFDPKSTNENPIWFMVDIEFVAKFPRVIALSELKEEPELSGMMVLQRGSRLSVQPVSAEHYAWIVGMSRGS